MAKRQPRQTQEGEIKMFGALLGMAVLKEVTVQKKKGQRRSNPFKGVSFGLRHYKKKKTKKKKVK